MRSFLRFRKLEFVWPLPIIESIASCISMSPCGWWQQKVWYPGWPRQELTRIMMWPFETGACFTSIWQIVSKCRVIPSPSIDHEWMPILEKKTLYSLTLTLPRIRIQGRRRSKIKLWIKDWLNIKHIPKLCMICTLYFINQIPVVWNCWDSYYCRVWYIIGFWQSMRGQGLIFLSGH